MFLVENLPIIQKFVIVDPRNFAPARNYCRPVGCDCVALTEVLPNMFRHDYGHR